VGGKREVGPGGHFRQGPISVRSTPEGPEPISRRVCQTGAAGTPAGVCPAASSHRSRRGVMDRSLADREQLRTNRLAVLESEDLDEQERARQCRIIEWEHRRGIGEDVDELLRREEGTWYTSTRQRSLTRNIVAYITGIYG